MIRAVIFDNDGVIADSHGIVNSIFTQMINRELAINITEEEFAEYSGMRFEQRAELLAKKKNIAVSREKIMDALNKGRLEYYTNGLSYVKAFPGVKRLLDELKDAGIFIGMGTNGSRKTVMQLLKHLDLEDYFDSIVTYNDVSNPKPAPDIFLQNADNFGVEPDECVVIEDSVEGLVAAKQAGMKAIAVQTTKQEADLEDADLIVKSINDINVNKIQALG